MSCTRAQLNTLIEVMADEAPNEACRKYILEWKEKIKKHARIEIISELL
jgi:hypothetical protein